MNEINRAIEHFRFGINFDIFSEPVTTYARLALAALQEQAERDNHPADDWQNIAAAYQQEARELKTQLCQLLDCPCISHKNRPLNLDELRDMVGQWVWVVVEYDRRSQAEGWALISTPAVVYFLEQGLPTNSVGKTFTAYRHRPVEITP